MNKERSLSGYRLSFRLLLALSALAISLFAISIIGFQFYRSASRFLTERNAQLDNKRFSQAASHISGKLDMLETVSQVNISDSKFSEAISNYRPDADYASLRALNDALAEIFNHAQFAIPETQGITLLCDEYSMWTENSLFNVADVRRDSFLSHFLFSPDDSCLHFPGDKTASDDSLFSRFDAMLLLSKPVVSNGKTVGTLCFVVNPSYLWDQLPADDGLAVLGRDGNVLYNSISLPDNELAAISTSEPSDPYRSLQLSEYGLTVIYQTGSFSLKSTLRILRLVYLAAGLVILLVSYGMASLFARPVVRPLEDLEHSIDSVQSRESLNRRPKPRHLSSREYFLIYLSVIVYSSSVLFSLFAFFYYRTTAANLLESSLSVSFRQALATTNESFENLNYNALYLSYRDGVTEGLSDPDNEETHAQLNSLLEESAQTFSLPLDIYLLDVSPRLLASTAYFSEDNPLLDRLPDRKAIFSSIPYRNGNAMRLSSQIIDLRNYKPVGYLILQVDELYLRQTYDFFPSDDYSIYLHTPEGLVISCSDENVIGQSLPAFGEKSKVVSRKLSSADLYLTVVYDNSALSGALSASFRNILYLLITLMGVLLLVNELISNYLSRRVQGLTDMLSGFSLDSLDSFQPQYSVIREINGVYSAFGEMTKRIRTLLDDNLAAEKRERALELEKRQAELLLLQSQINPHFLYNTFAAVNSAIADGQSTAAIHTLNVLADMLRFSTKNASLTVPVSEELRYASMYMDIMCMRNPDLLSVSFDFSEEALKQDTAKFILQPILENAISHGFEAKGGLGTIRVTGMVVGNRLIMVIRDDGIGLTPEEQDRLNNVLAGSEPQKGIGLANIAHRLRLIFGNHASLTVDSQDGCVVTIIQPILLPEENLALMRPDSPIETYADGQQTPSCDNTIDRKDI